MTVDFLRSIRETIGGCRALGALGLRAGLRFRGRYWRWRDETAFGAYPVPPKEKRRAALEYGRWVDHMKKLEQRRR